MNGDHFTYLVPVFFQDGITDIQAVFTDNRLFCRFTRPLSMNVYVGEEHRLQKIYDLNEEHYMILSWGDLFDGKFDNVYMFFVDVSSLKQHF